jgi:hypothetical protein
VGRTASGIDREYRFGTGLMHVLAMQMSLGY